MPLAGAQRESLLSARPLFRAHLDRGGTIVAIGPATKLMSAGNLTAVDEPAASAAGLALIPDCVVETDYDDGSAGRGRLLCVLARYARCVAIGVEKGAAIVLSSRKMRADRAARRFF